MGIEQQAPARMESARDYDFAVAFGGYVEDSRFHHHSQLISIAGGLNGIRASGPCGIEPFDYLRPVFTGRPT
jgi:hypothetical protein